MRRECREPFPRHRLQREPLVNDLDMHHGTCVTHMPWCMSGSLTRGGGETFPAFLAHAQPAILCIWQEAHGIMITPLSHRNNVATSFGNYDIMIKSAMVHTLLPHVTYMAWQLHTLQRRQSRRDCISKHRRLDCLLNRLFRRRSKKTSKLAILKGIPRRPVNSPHKEPVTRKMFPLDDVIMIHTWWSKTKKTFCIWKIIAFISNWIFPATEEIPHLEKQMYKSQWWIV